MKNGKNGEYYIGLDIGTNSIGWAVTNDEYEIQKFNGNAMWGICVLEESQTAEKRRTYRNSLKITCCKFHLLNKF